jgi:hypothetical protein
MLTRNALLPEYRDWLGSIEPSLFVTHNFGYDGAFREGCALSEAAKREKVASNWASIWRARLIQIVGP